MLMQCRKYHRYTSRKSEYEHISQVKYLWDFLSGYEIDAKKKFLDMPNILIAGCMHQLQVIIYYRMI